MVMNRLIYSIQCRCLIGFDIVVAFTVPDVHYFIVQAGYTRKITRRFLVGIGSVLLFMDDDLKYFFYFYHLKNSLIMNGIAKKI